MFWAHMQRIVLANGLTILHVPRDTDTVCIEVNVHTGSNHEAPACAGISHFIEHLLFEGTTSRPTSYAVSNEIERLGGEFNAATSNERTFFYVKVAKAHFRVALDVLADIIRNPLFDPKIIEKEKRIIIDEIKLVNDQPRYFQWVLFQNTLFHTHPAKNPIYGTESAIRGMTRQTIVDYYQKHYVPQNMTVVIVGSAVKTIDLIKRAFGGMQGTTPPLLITREPAPTHHVQKTVHRKTLQSYLILGYQTVPRDQKDSFVFDVIRAILGRGQSGKIFNEIRTKRGLAYDVGVLHNPSTDFGYFAIYVNTNPKNIPEVKRIILSEVSKLTDVADKDLSEAKTFLEGEFLLHTEDTQKMADVVAFWEQSVHATSVQDYLKNIRQVSREDITRAIRRYCRYHTLTVIR
jgi:predicted Zn-dependent peptidase